MHSCLNSDIQMKQWDINAVNATDFSSLEIGMIDSSTAQSIGITGATDWFQIIRIPWNTTYPGQILLTAAGKQEMYYRTCSNGTWQTPKRLVTNADLDGHIVLLSGGSTALEASSGNTRFRLQLNTNGNVTLYRSTDGGSTWPESKNVATWG